MRRPLHLAAFFILCAAVAPACLLDAGPYEDSTGASGPGGGGTGGTGTTGKTTGITTTPTGGGGTGGVASICGDGAITGGEECDDNNTAAGDGCSPTCVIEPGWSCTGEPSVCADGCGNGEIHAPSGEECDDGNVKPGDGCSQGCKIEEGYVCDGEPSVCEKTCGNSVLDPGETCDDGNDASGDGCSATCVREDGWLCDSDPLPSVCFPNCGDGFIVQGKEGCDDGDTDGSSKCNAACTAAVAGWVCDSVNGGPDSCSPICGDGLGVAGEACDDGNVKAGDGCSAACALEGMCGNNIVDPGEECDGNGAIAGECDATTCTLLAAAQTVCTKAPIIPAGPLNAMGAFETVYEGSNDPSKGNGMPLATGDVPVPTGCLTGFNAPVLHRYVTGNRPSFVTFETLATQPVSNQGTFGKTQIWVYRDCPRKADYEGCNNDGPGLGSRSRFTTGFLPAKTTLFVVVSGEGGGGGMDNGYYALKVVEQPVKLFFHEDFSSVTTYGVNNLVPSLTEMTTGDGGWRTCLAEIGNPCLGSEPPSHSGGAFGWAFSDAATATLANAVTPVFDFSGLTLARASYAYRVNNTPAAELGKVEPLNGNMVSGAVTYTPVSPNVQGRAFVTVPSSANAAVRFVYQDGSSATAGNFAIDDIFIYGY